MMMLVALHCWCYSDGRIIKEDTTKLSSLLKSCFVTKLRHLDGNLSHTIDYFEALINESRCSDTSFEETWYLYLVKCHTNAGSFKVEELGFAYTALQSLIKNMTVVNKVTEETGETSLILSSHLNEIVQDLDGNLKNTAVKWINVYNNHRHSQSKVPIESVHLSIRYIFQEAEQLDGNTIVDQPIDLFADDEAVEEKEEDEEEEVCQLIKQITLEDCQFSQKTKQHTRITPLPSYSLFKQGKQLSYENDFKYEVFNDMKTFKSASPLVLFHGPPGSGKTTLAKCISSSLCIENAPYGGLLIELSCAQVLSEYMNQSDQNIDALFADIEKYLTWNCHTKVFLVIDEVETLVRDREYLLNSSSPNSSLQLVNTMLVCFDRIRRFPQICIFTTSNLLVNIDKAFIDRVSMVYQVDSPSIRTIQKMLTQHFQLSSKINENELILLSELLYKTSASGRFISQMLSQLALASSNELSAFEAILVQTLHRCRDVS